MAENKLPKAAVYRNDWHNFRSVEVAKLFAIIPTEELAKLSPGESIWYPTDWPDGKIYGFSRSVVERVTDDTDFITIFTEGGGQFPILKTKRCGDLYRCCDDAKLLELAGADPKVTCTGRSLNPPRPSRTLPWLSN